LKKITKISLRLARAFIVATSWPANEEAKLLVDIFRSRVSATPAAAGSFWSLMVFVMAYKSMFQISFKTKTYILNKMFQNTNTYLHHFKLIRIS